MKTLIQLSAIVLLFACNGNSESKLDEIIAKRDSLKKEYSKIGSELKELDDQIALLDSTKKLTIVTTLTPEIKTFSHYFDIRGNVKAEKNTLIFPEVPGNITNIRVTEGDRVSKGQVLLTLDREVMSNQIVQVETSFELAKTIYKKQKALYDENIGSEVQYLQAKNNMETLDANLKSLKAQEDMYIIRAPFSGIVDEVIPNVGSMASPQMPVVRIVSLNKVNVEADVSERYIGKISKGTITTVYFPMLEKEIDTRLVYSGNHINENNRTFKIRVDLANTSDNQYKPNMVAKLRILDYQKDDAITLAASLIQQDSEGKDFVYTANKNGSGSHDVKKVYVETGLSYVGETEILSGINAESIIIDKGSRSVKKGQKVKIVTES